MRLMLLADCEYHHICCRNREAEMATRDWVALALALRIIMDGVDSASADFQTVAQWWDDRLRTRKLKDWQEMYDQITRENGRLTGSNVAHTMEKIGIEPTAENYFALVDAGRRLMNPRCRLVWPRLEKRE